MAAEPTDSSSTMIASWFPDLGPSCPLWLVHRSMNRQVFSSAELLYQAVAGLPLRPLLAPQTYQIKNGIYVRVAFFFFFQRFFFYNSVVQNFRQNRAWVHTGVGWGWGWGWHRIGVGWVGPMPYADLCFIFL